MEKLYLSGREAREFTGFCDRTLYAKRVAGEIDYIKCGNTIRYPLDSLKAYFEKYRASANREALAVTMNDLDNPHRGEPILDFSTDFDKLKTATKDGK